MAKADLVLLKMSREYAKADADGTLGKKKAPARKNSAGTAKKVTKKTSKKK